MWIRQKSADLDLQCFRKNRFEFGKTKVNNLIDINSLSQAFISLMPIF